MKNSAFNFKFFLILAFVLVSFIATSCSDSGSSDDNNADGDSESDSSTENDGDSDSTESSDNNELDNSDGDSTTDTDVIEYDTTAPSDSVVLNEIDCYGTDWIELANTATDAPADVSFWIIADDLKEGGHQYALPEGTLIPPGGYLVIKEEKDSEAGFGFGVKCGSDTIYLVNPNREIAAQTTLPDIPNGSSWGRLPDKTGDFAEALPTQGAANQQPETRTDELFDPKKVHTISITLSDANKTALNSTPYEYVEADFSVTMDGSTETIAKVGMRLKSGDSYRPLSGKAAIKIRFNKYDSDLRLFGLKNLTINNMINDKSMMHETVAYKVFNEFNVPAPRTGYAEVKINDVSYGLYVIMEKYDDIFTSKIFVNSQHVFEGTEDLLTGKVAEFEVDEGDSADVKDLETLIDVINNTSDDQWYVKVSEITDMTEMVRMWVTENYIGHDDGYTNEANNYFLHSNESNVFSMMPWGTDLTFVQDLTFPTGDKIMFKKCIASSVCNKQYYSELSGLVAKVNSLNLASWIDEIKTAITPFVQSDTKKEATEAEYNQAVTDLKAYLVNRKTKAEAAINN